MVVCENTECSENGVPKTLGNMVLGPGDVVICGRCGRACVLKAEE